MTAVRYFQGLPRNVIIMKCLSPVWSIVPALIWKYWHDTRRLTTKRNVLLHNTVCVKCTGPSCRKNVTRPIYCKKHSGVALRLTSETKRFVVKMYRFVSPRRRNERDCSLGRRLRVTGTYGSPRWRFWLEQQLSSHETGPDRTTPTLQLTEPSSVIYDSRHTQFNTRQLIQSEIHYSGPLLTCMTQKRIQDWGRKGTIWKSQA